LMNNRAAGLTYGIADEQNFHMWDKKGKTPHEACGITYLNLLNRWASYPRFRGPRDPEG
jgi:hypothetical protein